MKNNKEHAIAFFSNGELEDAQRAHNLEAGLSLAKSVIGVKVDNIFEHFCGIAISGATSSIDEFEQELNARNMGTVERNSDRPAFQGATAPTTPA